MAQKMRASLEGRTREEKEVGRWQLLQNSPTHTLFLVFYAIWRKICALDLRTKNESKRMKLVLFRLRLVKHKIYSHQLFLILFHNNERGIVHNCFGCLLNMICSLKQGVWIYKYY